MWTTIFSLLDDAFSLFCFLALVSLDSVFDSEVDFELVSLLASPFLPFAGVVGNVPAGTFELEGCVGNKLL